MRKLWILLALFAVGTAAWADDWAQVLPNSGEVPLGAFKAGVDTGGGPLYLARTNFKGGLVVGKYAPAYHKAYFPYGGKEWEFSDKPVEVFVGYGFWVLGSAGKVPEGVISAGQESDGSPLYMIRARLHKSISCGKYSSKYDKGYIPYGGKEYEVKRKIYFLVKDEAPDSE